MGLRPVPPSIALTAMRSHRSEQLAELYSEDAAQRIEIIGLIRQRRRARSIGHPLARVEQIVRHQRQPGTLEKGRGVDQPLLLTEIDEASL